MVFYCAQTLLLYQNKERRVYTKYDHLLQHPTETLASCERTHSQLKSYHPATPHKNKKIFTPKNTHTHTHTRTTCKFTTTFQLVRIKNKTKRDGRGSMIGPSWSALSSLVVETTSGLQPELQNKMLPPQFADPAHAWWAGDRDKQTHTRTHTYIHLKLLLLLLPPPTTITTTTEKNAALGVVRSAASSVSFGCDLLIFLR